MHQLRRRAQQKCCLHLTGVEAVRPLLRAQPFGLRARRTVKRERPEAEIRSQIRAITSTSDELPPCVLYSVNFLNPEAATLAPTSRTTAMNVAADNDRVPGNPPDAPLLLP